MMGLFNRRKKEIRSIIKKFYGNNSDYFIYTYANNIYSIPEVRTAIETMADIFATIPIYHKIVDKNENTIYLNDSVSYCLNSRPNTLQNGVQFWKTTITQLLLNSNVFLEPIFDNKNGTLKSIYPLPLKTFKFELNEENSYVNFYDIPNGSISKQYNLKDLIYLNRFSALGGGKTTNLGLYETVIQALSNRILKNSSPNKVKAILQGNLGSSPNLKAQDRKGTMKDLKTNFDENVEGIAYVEPQWKITPVNWEENDVNCDLMSFCINIVYNYFGITEKIINNTCSEIEREMFIANSVKPLAKQIEQELTNKLFTEREIQFGHRIELDTFALSVSTVTAKTSLINVACRNGVFNINEMREIFGYTRLPDGLGDKYRASADCVDIAIVDDYQLGKVGSSKDTQKSEDKNTQKEEDNERSNEKKRIPFSQDGNKG